MPSSFSSSVDPPAWQWPEDLPGAWNTEPPSSTPPKTEPAEPSHPQQRHASSHPQQRHASSHPQQRHASAAQSSEQPPPHSSSSDQVPPSSDSTTGQPLPHQQRERFYRPRTCRICLETVLPTFHPPSDSLPNFMRSSPSVTYETEEGGRLLRPCLCKGSQKYVHEQCLQAWRMQDPTAKRNYWQCPTCRYKYRLERMNWGRWISGTSSQILLTLVIFITVSFALGYVADPIINLYLDPYDTIAHGSQPLLDPDEPVGWAEHFVKGLASLGLLGFAKFLFTLSPFQWYNMRGSGLMRGTRTTGRDRMNQISWIAVVVGILTFVWAVWKGVRAWSRRVLTAASERVVDVPGAEDDDDDDE